MRAAVLGKNLSRRVYANRASVKNAVGKDSDRASFFWNAYYRLPSTNTKEATPRNWTPLRYFLNNVYGSRQSFRRTATAVG